MFLQVKPQSVIIAVGVTTGQILKPPSVVRVFPTPRWNIKNGGKMTPRGEQGGGMGVR